MSLPHLLKTEINTIPSYIPYLYSDNKKIDEWSKKLKTDKLKIGIAGKVVKKIDIGRSFSLSYFKDISEINGLQLISLYKGEDEDKILDIDFDLKTLGRNFDEGNNAYIDTDCNYEL